nr:MAG TPA: hypothetical protein [Caudoviricetes sp.]
MSSDIKHNAEGYKDSTAYKAIQSVSAEEKKLAIQSDHDKLILHLKYMIELAGFRLSDRIRLVHKVTGRKFD